MFINLMNTEYFKEFIMEPSDKDTLYLALALVIIVLLDLLVIYGLALKGNMHLITTLKNALV